MRCRPQLTPTSISSSENRRSSSIISYEITGCEPPRVSSACRPARRSCWPLCSVSRPSASPSHSSAPSASRRPDVSFFPFLIYSPIRKMMISSIAFFPLLIPLGYDDFPYLAFFKQYNKIYKTRFAEQYRTTATSLCAVRSVIELSWKIYFPLRLSFM